MKNKMFARKPIRNLTSWIEFILSEGSVPAIVEARNNSGGLYRGMRTKCWDFDGEYFAIHNNKDNAVWCHKNNLKLLSKGTVSTLQQFKNVKFDRNYREILKAEKADCGLYPTYRL